MKISVLCHVYNCEDTLADLHGEVTEVLADLNIPYEIIFVNDASTDKSWKEIKRLEEKDNHVIALNFRRKYGTAAALQAGFDIAKGEYIFTISPTLENTPKELKVLLATLEARDLDLVIGRRENKLKGRLFKHLLANAGNTLISKLIGTRLTDVTSPMRLIKSDVVKRIRIYGDQHTFLPAIATLYGANIEEVSIKHSKPRNAGYIESTISPVKALLDLTVLKLILAFSTPPFTSPIRIFGMGGLISLSMGIGAVSFLTYIKLFLGQDIGGRPLLQFGILGIIIGVQFIALGVIGDLMFHTYFESQNKRVYTLKEDNNIK
ncbi:glycosyltransferase family 2 protein [Patescibacteria group bacterium]|nr:glycosyltransferase family 2 protein [Patescibacteria group bacterium]